MKALYFFKLLPLILLSIVADKDERVRVQVFQEIVELLWLILRDKPMKRKSAKLGFKMVSELLRRARFLLNSKAAAFVFLERSICHGTVFT